MQGLEIRNNKIIKNIFLTIKPLNYFWIEKKTFNYFLTF